jgi:Uma2 family endonuclease
MTLLTRFTSADLPSLPDLPGVRYEIIDGELWVSKQPTLGHQYASTALSSALFEWSSRTGTGVTLFEPGLVFAEDNDVIPDVIWISRERLTHGQDTKGHLTVAPELVVEVLSPGRANEVRDRGAKLELYGRRGVEEYWIVDWQHRAVSVHRRAGVELTEIAVLRDGELLTSPLLPEFACPISNLWNMPTGQPA